MCNSDAAAAASAADADVGVPQAAAVNGAAVSDWEAPERQS